MRRNEMKIITVLVLSIVAIISVKQIINNENIEIFTIILATSGVIISRVISNINFKNTKKD